VVLHRRRTRCCSDENCRLGCGIGEGYHRSVTADEPRAAASSRGGGPSGQVAQGEGGGRRSRRWRRQRQRDPIWLLGLSFGGIRSGCGGWGGGGGRGAAHLVDSKVAMGPRVSVLCAFRYVGFWRVDGAMGISGRFVGRRFLQCDWLLWFAGLGYYVVFF
jgi:hypothetical protein